MSYYGDEKFLKEVNKFMEQKTDIVKFYILTYSDGIHGTNTYGVFSTKEKAEEAMSTAIKNYAKCYGGQVYVIRQCGESHFSGNGLHLHITPFILDEAKEI